MVENRCCGPGVDTEKMEEMMVRMKEFCGQGKMAEMMVEMMPHCLSMLLPSVPKEKRTDFVVQMVGVLLEQGSAGMSEAERREFVAKIAETVKA